MTNINHFPVWTKFDFFSIQKIEMFKYWRLISNVGGPMTIHWIRVQFFSYSTTLINYINPINMNNLKMNLKCSTLSRLPAYPLRLQSAFPAIPARPIKLFSWRKDDQTIYVMCVWSFLIDSMIVFLKNFIAFSFVFEIQFFSPMKVYLFVLHLLLHGLSYVLDIFLDSVWPIDCFWAQFFAMIPTISHTIPINRNFQWLNAQTNRIPHIFPFHFIIFFCRFVFSTERVFLLS